MYLGLNVSVPVESIRPTAHVRVSSLDLRSVSALNASVPLADSAPRQPVLKIASLGHIVNWGHELVLILNDGQPEAVSVVVEVTSTSRVAFDEGRSPEFFKARTWRRQQSSATRFAGAGVHQEGVTDPHWHPFFWAFRDLSVLRVNSQDRSVRLADGTPGDVSFEISSSNGPHVHWVSLVSRQPVRVVVPLSILALLVQAASQVWHGAEALETRTSRAEILVVRSLVTLHVQEGVTRPDGRSSHRASWGGTSLRVSSEHDAMSSNIDEEIDKQEQGPAAKDMR